MSFNDIYDQSRHDMRRFYRELDRLSHSTTSSDEELEDEIVDFRTVDELSIYHWLRIRLYNFLSNMRFLRG